jgi:Uma2 family endonuclease
MTDLIQNAIGSGIPSAEPILPTLDEFLSAYAQQPVEVINGEIVPMHPPGFPHVAMAEYIRDSIRDFLKVNPVGRVYKENPFLLDASDRSDWVRDSRTPDVAFITEANFKEVLARLKTQSDPARVVPDLAVEVISPNDTYAEVDLKLADYVRFGVQMILIVNPRTRTVRKVVPETSEDRTYSDQEIVTGSPVLEGWTILVANIFDKPFESQLL